MAKPLSTNRNNVNLEYNKPFASYRSSKAPIATIGKPKPKWRVRWFWLRCRQKTEKKREGGGEI
jgi:hypothetical protein